MEVVISVSSWLWNTTVRVYVHTRIVRVVRTALATDSELMILHGRSLPVLMDICISYEAANIASL